MDHNILLETCKLPIYYGDLEPNWDEGYEPHFQRRISNNLLLKEYDRLKNSTESPSDIAEEICIRLGKEYHDKYMDLADSFLGACYAIDKEENSDNPEVIAKAQADFNTTQRAYQNYVDEAVNIFRALVDADENVMDPPWCRDIPYAAQHLKEAQTQEYKNLSNEELYWEYEGIKMDESHARGQGKDILYPGKAEMMEEEICKRAGSDAYDRFLFITNKISDLTDFDELCDKEALNNFTCQYYDLVYMCLQKLKEMRW